MAEESRSSQQVVSSEFKRPCVAIVRNHLDSTYMGGLEVELLTTGSGNSTNAPGQLLPVKYLSPFYGLTSYDGTSKNDGHQNSQRSYGFWGVPPDIGAKVLVIFTEGGDGYWIGCIPEENTNFMTPDQFSSTTFNSQDKSKKLPVVEYNKKTEKGTGRDTTQYVKPVNTDALAVLTTQGLNDDDIRGVTTSSARRETPSTVFGLSSPGPQDKRPGAPRVNYGENFSQTPVPQNRLGGTSIVMDDGDATLLRKTPASSGPPVYVNVEKGDKGGDPTLPHNELFRIRTRTGHQILLHNTEDLIYIGNARGTAWVELTSNGKIDIYAADSISVHSEKDINFKADKNIYFEAGESIHMKAGTSIFETAASNIELKAGADGKITAGGSTNIKSAHHIETAGTIDMNGPSAAAAADAQPSQRIPMHEPWAGHENLWNATAPATPDTFKKSTQREAGATPTVKPPEATTTAPTTAQPDAATTGVTKTPTPNTAVPASVASAASAVNTAMSTANVANLASAIKDVGTKMTFGMSQAITGTIDAIASSSALTAIKNVGGTAINSLTQAASNLLDIRTTVAKGQVPSIIPSGSEDTTNTLPADREAIAAIGKGNVAAGSTVTLSDGNTYTVSKDDTTGNWTVG